MASRRTRIPAAKDDWRYRQLWRIVDGAVAAAFDAHPNYLTDVGRRSARASIVKRVTGSVLGYAEQVSARGRSGQEPAVETKPALYHVVFWRLAKAVRALALSQRAPFRRGRA